MRERCSARALLARLADALDRVEARLGTALTEDKPLFVDVSTAANLLGVSKQSIERAVKSKELPSKLICGRRLVPRKAIEELAEA
jgi:excisionase family DNA binding protein